MNIEIIDMRIAVPVSTAEITGFAIPAVVADDTNLVELVDPLIAREVPPPAIIAKAQVMEGSRSLTTATIMAVPAMAAKGTAMVSKALSTHGIR